MSTKIAANLVQFDITNYRSIKDTLSISMVAGKARKNTFYCPAAGTHLMKSAVIYGANASGKSNVLRALYFFTGLIKDETVIYDKASSEIDPEPFMLDDDSKTKPTVFTLHIAHGSKLFVYEASFDYRTSKIIGEQLRVKTPNTSALVTVFTRERNDIVINRYKSNEIQHDIQQSSKQLLQTETLFVTTLAGLAKKNIAHEFTDAIKKISVYNSLVHNALPFIFNLLKRNQEEEGAKHIKDLVIEFLSGADLSIIDLKLKKIEGEDTLFVVHQYRDASNKISKKAFPFYEESEGTRKIIANAFPIIGSIMMGNTYVVDELDGALHPTLLRHIVKLFNSSENGAQLLMTSHDATLIDDRDDFTTDQIFFIEKRVDHSSDIYSLSDFSAIRNDTPNLSKRYLNGEFGANPNIEQLYRVKK